jgi:hypothetical protein
MTDIKSIHFRSFLIKREEVRQDQKIQEYHDKIQVLGTLLVSLSKISLVGASVDEMLKLLHASAVKNNDLETLIQCELICKNMNEQLK